MANILEQMVELGYNQDTEQGQMVLQLAAWEVMANNGELAVDPDQLAAIRHYIQYSSQPAAS
jgi:hypothetical protein